VKSYVAAAEALNEKKKRQGETQGTDAVFS